MANLLELSEKLKKLFQSANPVRNFQRGVSQWKQAVPQVKRQIQKATTQFKSELQPSTYESVMQKYRQNRARDLQNVNKFVSSYESKIPTFKVSAPVKAMFPALKLPDIVKGAPRFITKSIGYTPEGMKQAELEKSYFEKAQRGMKPSIGEFKAIRDIGSKIAFGATSAPKAIRGIDAKMARSIFKVKKNATVEEINTAYRKLQLKEYPRTVQEIANRSKQNAAKIVNEAKRVLLEEAKLAHPVKLLKGKVSQAGLYDQLPQTKQELNDYIHKLDYTTNYHKLSKN